MAGDLRQQTATRAILLLGQDQCTASGRRPEHGSEPFLGAAQVALNHEFRPIPSGEGGFLHPLCLGHHEGACRTCSHSCEQSATGNPPETPAAKEQPTSRSTQHDGKGNSPQERPRSTCCPPRADSKEQQAQEGRFLHMPNERMAWISPTPILPAGTIVMSVNRPRHRII